MTTRKPKHDFQLHHRISKDDTRGVQFYYCIVSTLNNLLREVVNATNVNAFMNKLDAVRRNEALKFEHRIPLQSD